MFETIQQLAQNAAKAEHLLKAIQQGGSSPSVVIKPWHRWGKSVEEAKRIHENPKLAQVKAILEDLGKTR